MRLLRVLFSSCDLYQKPYHNNRATTIQGEEMSTDPTEAQFVKMLTFMKQPKQASAAGARYG